jgi:CRP-like cAMP-binding protein
MKSSAAPQKAQCESCQDPASGFFCLLENQGLTRINTDKKHNKFAKGQVVFERGDKPEGLFCVLRGVVKVETENEEGKSHILRIAGPGQVLGYRALFSQSTYQARAIAHEDSEICFIPKATIDEVVKSSPALALKFLELLSEDVRRAEERLCSASDKDTAARVAETLLFLESHYTPERPWSRKEIADWAGTTPETVMRTLSSFEDKKWIRSEGKRIKILDARKLSALSQR